MTPTPSAADRPPDRFQGVVDGAVVATAVALQGLSALPAEVSSGWAIATGAAATAVACVAGRRRPAVGDGIRRFSGAGRLVLRVTCAILPVGGALLGGILRGGAAAPESILLAVTAGAVLAQLAGAGLAADRRFAVASSAFLVVLSTIVVTHPASAALQTLYAALGSVWLAARRDGPGDGVAGSAPWRVSLLLPCLVVAAMVAASSGAIGETARAVSGFMPFSGGDTWNDPWGNDGIGDGENLVAGEREASSSGPVDSTLFLTSQRPSLYDLWNDQYGEPPRAREEQERAAALESSEVLDSEGRTADSDHAGREFATVRGPRRRSRRPPDIAARALVTVDGPTPVLLRLSAFEHFDGGIWSAGVGSAGAVEAVGGDWMRVVPREEGGGERHAVTVGTLESPVLPLPTGCQRLRIPRIGDPTMYRMVTAGLPALDRARVPAGTTVTAVGHPLGIDGRDPHPDLPVAPAAAPRGDRPAAAWIDDLLARWEVAPRPGSAPEWETAARVVAAIRGHAQFDPDARPPDGVSDTVRHFLVHEPRGPAYQFAGATALVLRHLGFRTRLASGLRVSGERRDPRSRRGVATGEDVHFWAEVEDAAGRWIPVESTPGFVLRGAAPTFARTLRALLRRIQPASLRDAIRRSVLLGAGWLLVAAVLHRRRRVADAIITALWRWELRRKSICPLEATWRLLERRGRIAGRPRPAHETARRWYLESCGAAAGEVPPAEGFIRAFETVIYGRREACLDRATHRRIALAAERAWTLSALERRSGEARAAPSCMPFPLFLLRRRNPA